MRGLTDFITEVAWEDIALVLFVQIDDAYRILVQRFGPCRQRGPAPEVSDSEVLTWVVLCELFFQGDETRFCHYLAQYLRALFPSQLTRPQFNRRRRALTGALECIRRWWRDHLLPRAEDIRLIDSAPVPVCTYARSNRCQTVRGAEYCGRIAAKKARFFGFRLHATVTPEQLIDEWLLAPASVHDVRVAPELLAEEAEIAVIGDGAYGSAAFEAALWDDALVQLLPIRRANEPHQWEPSVRRLLIGVRMRVETAFSQLTVVLGFGLTHARSLVGVVNRVASKILAHTFCFLWHRVALAWETHT
jgi:hypothetical protein